MSLIGGIVFVVIVVFVFVIVFVFKRVENKV